MSANEQMNRPKVMVLLGFMLVAGVMRALHLPFNIAPIGAMALFGGAYFIDRRLAYLLPLVAMLFSDFVLQVLFMAGLRDFPGFHGQMLGVYVGFLGSVFIGSFLQNRVGVLSVIGASLAASTLFFVTSNLSVWLGEPQMYTHDLKGLTECFVAALPFFRNSILGDVVFSAILFGTFELLKFKFPKLAYVRR